MTDNPASMMLIEAAHGIEDKAMLTQLLEIIVSTHLTDNQCDQLSNKVGRIPHQRLRGHDDRPS